VNLPINQVVQGDCLETMRTFPPASVGLIVTSPPFNLGMRKRFGRWTKENCFGSRVSKKWAQTELGNGYDGHEDAMPREDYEAWQKEVLLECWRVLTPDGAIFYNHKPRVQERELILPLELIPADLKLRQIIIWSRGSGFNTNRYSFVSSHEWLMLLAKPGFALSAGASSLGDVWEIPPARNNPHPAPFPVALAERAIASTDKQIILDPFGGSGTTAIAAINCHRDYILIEQSKKYCEMADERIEKHLQQPKLFVS
jgi:site-specific DNA-methyltransferase (adenine-specific)